jgi:4-oxalocrotonate tautomerase
MPVITIDMWEGRTSEEKEKMIKNITETLSESMNIPKEVIHVIIKESPMENWGIGGKQASKMEFDKK